MHTDEIAAHAATRPPASRASEGEGQTGCPRKRPSLETLCGERYSIGWPDGYEPTAALETCTARFKSRLIAAREKKRYGELLQLLTLASWNLEDAEANEWPKAAGTARAQIAEVESVLRNLSEPA